MFRFSAPLLTLTLLLLTPAVALAEGSWELKGDGDRPFLLYRLIGGTFAGVPRQNKMFVYANAKETINLGSSAVGVGQGRINYIAPDGETGTCDGTKGGLIGSIAQEKLGPFEGGYTPCAVKVGEDQAGIWQVQFISPDPSSNASFDLNSLQETAINDWNTNGRQATDEFFVTAWDITVTDKLGSPVTPGRVFMNYLPGRLGQGAAFNSTLYVLTKDGFQYRISFTDLDPDGFALFANNKGFRDGTIPNSPPIFASIPLPGDAINAPFSIHSPDVRDDDDNTTHRLFINPPSTDLPATARVGVNISDWLLTPPQTPPEPQDFRFLGQDGTIGQAGSFPMKGDFIFINPSDRTATYTIALDLDGDGKITTDDNSPDRILIGIAKPGKNIISWDGLDGQGNPVTPGDFTFQASMKLAIGEVHFPLVDPENNKSGFVIERLNGPPTDRSVIYYNNARAPLGGESAIAGVNSAGGANRWTENFGNERGIDTWANAPSQSISAVDGFTIKEADLEITKRLEPDASEIAAGSAVTYIIEVINPDTSPSGVNNVPVLDTIPSEITNVTWTCAGENGGVCNDLSGSGNNLNTTANLPKNSKVIYTISGIVDITAVGAIENTAEITRLDDVNDPDEDNNKSTVGVNIVPPLPTTLIIKKETTGDRTFIPGQTVEYIITINNTGDHDALNVVVDDQALLNLDLGITFLGNSGDHCIGAFPCIFDLIPPDETRTITSTYQIPLNYTGPDTLTNVATVDFDNDGNTGNNTASHPVDLGRTEVEIVKTIIGEPLFNPGEEIRYQIEVTNTGNHDAVNVRVEDRSLLDLNFGIDFVGNSDSCTMLFPCTFDLIPAGEARTITSTYRIPDDYQGPDTLTNTANVTFSNDADPNSDDRTSTETISLAPVDPPLMTDIEIEKEADARFTPGEAVTYKIRLRNLGDVIAENVILYDQDLLDLGFVLDQQNSDCTTLPCTVGDIPVGDNNDDDWVVIRLTFIVPIDYEGPEILTNTAEVEFDNDVDPNNNTATATSTIYAADLIVTKEGETSGPAEQYTYTITARNNGPSTAENVVIQDQLATGAEFVSASEGGVYDPDSHTVTWAVGDLLPSGDEESNERSIIREVTVTLPINGSFTNRASGTSDTPDITPSNNEASVTTEVVVDPDPDPLPVLFLTKEGPERFNPGDVISYNFTITNPSTTNALDVFLTDEVLTSLGFIFQPSDICPTLPCNLGTIFPGTSPPFALDFLVPQDYTNIELIDHTTTLIYRNNPNPDQPIQAAVPTRLLNADLITTKRELESGTLGEYTYQIKTENIGDDPAVNVRITDEIPAGVTVLNISHGGRQEGNLIIWDVASLEVGIDSALVFTVTLGLDTPGEYTNIARSTSDTFDPKLDNNDGSNAVVTTEVIVEPDPDPDPVVLPKLNLTAIGPERFNPGQLFSYDVILENENDADALNVILDNPLFRSLGFEFQPSDICPTLPCSLGNLPKGKKPPLTLTFRVPDTYNNPGILEYTTVVTYKQTADDAEPINLNVKLEAELPVADLETDMDRVELTPNEQELRVNTTNLGPDTAENVNVVLELPNGVEVLEISSGGQQVGNTIVWPVGNLGPNQSVENFVRVAINEQEEGESFAIARSDSDTFDRDPSKNNGSQDSAREQIKIPVVQEPTDVAVKITPPASFQPGETVEFTYVITNEGDVLANNVAFATTPIPGLEFLGQEGDDCTPNFACDLGDLPPGESRTITIAYRVPDDFTGTTLETKATVTMDNPDSEPDNNEAIASIPLQTGEPSLELLKRITNVLRNGVSLGGINFNQVISPPPSTGTPWQPVGVITIPPSLTLQSGDVIEYTLYLRSTGGVAVENVQVCDLIPTQTTFIPDSFGTGRGLRLILGDETRLLTNQTDDDGGRYVAPLNPVAAPCQNTNNPNGAIWVESLTLEPGATGTIQFRVRLD